MTAHRPVPAITTATVVAILAAPVDRNATSVARSVILLVTAPKAPATVVAIVVVAPMAVAMAAVRKPATLVVDTATWLVTVLRDKSAITVCD